jgi:hypothetical protein
LSYNKIEINAGNGYSPIEPGGSINVSYSSGGEKRILMRITLANGEQLLSSTEININTGNAGDGSKTRTDVKYGSYVTTIEGAPYRGVQTKADIFVRYVSGISMQKPLIFVEGFDPRSMGKGNYGNSNIYTFVNKIDSLYKITNSPNKILDKYDIVYVDWVNSEEYIQANANTLMEVIRWVNRLKKLSGSTSSNIVMGHSMGGLVARYALKTMENNNEKHETSLYISDDSPHLGANAPLGALYGLYGLCSFLENKKLIGEFADKYFHSGTLLSLVEKIAHCNAAKQMLVNYVDFGGNLNNSEHIAWQQELANLGFPQGDKNSNFRMLGIAKGSYSENSAPSSYLKFDLVPTSDYAGLPGYSDLARPIIELVLNDIWSGILNLIPGKSTIKFHMEVDPGIANGTKIAEIKLQYVKKFLWMKNITRTVFEYNNYMPGSLAYDVFPSSYYAIQKGGKYNGSYGIPVVGQANWNLDMAGSTPFIPTSSALCVGFGKQTLTSSLFTDKPDFSNTPFGNNVYVSEGLSISHTDLNNMILDWLTAQLDFGIIGPRQGINGSKYVIPNGASVQWTTDNQQIATLDQGGNLKVVGNGIVNITAAQSNAIKASMEILTGDPSFVLEDVKRVPGYYSVKTDCTDTRITDFLNKYSNVITYEWGIKMNDEPLTWIKSESQELRLSTLENDDNVTVYLKALDLYGNESSPLFMRISGNDIYKLGYKTLIFNSKGELYSGNGAKLYYDYITMPLTYQNGNSSTFSDAEWNPVAAVVMNDENESRVIPWKRYGYIHDIIPSSEIEKITSSSDGTVLIYKLILLNYNGDIIQKTPITIMYKANFPNK